MQEIETESTRERRVRRLAEMQGLKLTKLREGNKFYAQYGPWMLSDLDTGMAQAWGMELDRVEEELAT